jgi:hypothetical protein
VFSIAVGKPIYLELACALARSFRLWNWNSDLRFFLATDARRESLPKDLQDIDFISLDPGQYGKGFSPKLHLDKIAPAETSLFVDADCLCVGSLSNAFDMFRGHAVSAIGREISSGEWFGDVALTCRRFDVSTLPRFNGGVYYLEKGESCSRVYQTARELEPRYDEIGFKRLRGCPNDEVLLSLAMAIHGQKPIPETGEIMNSLLAGPAGLSIDVFKGHALLRNPRNHPKHNDWYDLEESRPKLVHFLGSDVNTYPYRQEIMRLRLVSEKSWPVWMATLWAKLAFSWPWQSREKLQDLFRPIYHAAFGPRSIRPTRF